MNLTKRFLVAAAVAMISASFATAASIDIKNASFEEPALDAGGWSDVNLHWGDDDGERNEDGFTEHIAGFVADGNNHTGIPEGAEQSQNLGVALTPNTTYTLTVAVGNRNPSFTVPGNESRIGLYAGGDAQGGGTLLAEAVFDASNLAESSFADLTAVYNSGSDPVAGDVWISLQASGLNRSHFDNVRLDAVVPEPTSLTLVGMAVLGLVYRRRR